MLTMSKINALDSHNIDGALAPSVSSVRNGVPTTSALEVSLLLVLEQSFRPPTPEHMSSPWPPGVVGPWRHVLISCFPCRHRSLGKDGAP